MSTGRILAVAVSAVVTVAFVAGLLWTQVISPSEPYQRQSATVSVDGLPAHWESTYKGAAWYGVTGMPTWDGATLSTKTTSTEDAIIICGALSSWWVTSEQPFESVRVFGPDGGVLASRHVESEQCARK